MLVAFQLIDAGIYLFRNFFRLSTSISGAYDVTKIDDEEIFQGLCMDAKERQTHLMVSILPVGTDVNAYIDLLFCVHLP